MQSACYRYKDYNRSTSNSNTFLELLVSRKGLEISDTKNIVYTYLGIVADKLRHNLLYSNSQKTNYYSKVDYSKNVSQVFSKVACFYLEKYQNYWILNYVEDVDLLEQQPSLLS